MPMIIFFFIMCLVSIGGIAFLVLRNGRLSVLPSQEKMREWLVANQTLPREVFVELEVPARAFWHIRLLPWCYRYTEQLVHRFHFFAGRVERALLEGARRVRKRRVNKERANALQIEGQGFWNDMLEWKNGSAEQNKGHTKTTTPQTQSSRHGIHRGANDSSSASAESGSK